VYRIAIAEELGLGRYRMVRQRATVYPQENRRSGYQCLATQTEKKKACLSLTLLMALIVVGLLLWLVNRFGPMAGSIKSILNGVVVIGLAMWLLNVFGIFHSLSRVPAG
jgi:predicted membrane protein